MHSRIVTLLATTIAAVAGLALSVAPASAATTVISNLSSPSPFTAFERDTGSVAIGTRFGAPTGFGSGSLELETPLSNDKAQAISTQVAAVTALL